MRDDVYGATTEARVRRACALAITYGQEARQRYTEALAHTRGTHDPVDLERIWERGDTAAGERARYVTEFRSADPERPAAGS